MNNYAEKFKEEEKIYKEYDDVSTKGLQTFFEFNNYYYNLCNLIYENMYDNSSINTIQKSLSDYLSYTTHTKSNKNNINTTLSKTAYNKSVEQIKVYKNSYSNNNLSTSVSSKLSITTSSLDVINNNDVDISVLNADSYFLSIATILNEYNSKNIDNQITYEFKSKKKITKFNAYRLRHIVVETFFENDMLFAREYNNAKKIAKYLNNLYTRRIVELINTNAFTEPNIYNIIFENYNKYPNLFISFINGINKMPNFLRPFVTIDASMPHILNYILKANYNTNDTINHILCMKLNLNIFTITKDLDVKIYEKTCPIYYINSSRDNFTNICPNWKHFLFLYLDDTDNNYKQISFNFTLPTNSNPTRKIEVSLFENVILSSSSFAIIPHFYIFLLYYATIYISLNEEYKKQNIFFKDVFQLIDTIFNNIYKKYQKLEQKYNASKTKSAKTKNELKKLTDFFLYFTLLFPNQKLYLKETYGILQIQKQNPSNKQFVYTVDIKENYKNMEGGQLSRYLPPRYQQQQYLPLQYQQQRYLQRYLPPQYQQQQYLPLQYQQQRYLPPQYQQQRYLPPQYQQKIHQPKIINSNMSSDSSKLAYSVTIDMELRPGTKLSNSELINGKCNNKWNKIRKSYSILTGQKYVIPPVYKNLTSKKPDKPTKKQNYIPNKRTNNYTRKYQPNRNYFPYGRKNYNNYNRNITRRRLY